ncbi:MAG: 6-phosphogluconolactonase [Fusobacteria bacterium]|nr:MAG: 6-phosphogluconolactonase [Fusobacteriota bacterium]
MNNKMKKFNSQEEMNKYSIEIIEDELRKKKTLSIGFSGGKTPISFFKLLSLDTNIDWSRINVFLVDERWVPFTHEDSNFGMIKRTLFDKISIPQENVHRIPYFNTPKESLLKYQKDLKKFFGTNIVFDLLFLGIGSDGHTASIFELEEGLKDDDVIFTHSERHPHLRISLGMKVINLAKRKIFLLGPEKLELLEEPLDTNLPFTLVEDPEFLYYTK